jgi:hypothetical protein
MGDLSGGRWLKREEKGVKWGIERDGGLAREVKKQGEKQCFWGLTNHDSMRRVA